jgi:hypothetical protein
MAPAPYVTCGDGLSGPSRLPPLHAWTQTRSGNADNPGQGNFTGREMPGSGRTRRCKSFSSRADKSFCVVMPIGLRASRGFVWLQGLWPRHKRLPMSADSSPEVLSRIFPRRAKPRLLELDKAHDRESGATEPTAPGGESFQNRFTFDPIHSIAGVSPAAVESLRHFSKPRRGDALPGCQQTFIGRGVPGEPGPGSSSAADFVFECVAEVGNI